VKTIFVDECKQGHYILSGHVVSDKDIPLLRKTLKSALTSGQRYFRFSKEKDGRRIQMLNTFKELHCEAIVIVCRREAGPSIEKGWQ
jgi:molybdopterin biosynthesis enzyme MoaB